MAMEPVKRVIASEMVMCSRFGLELDGRNVRTMVVILAGVGLQVSLL